MQWLLVMLVAGLARTIITSSPLRISWREEGRTQDPAPGCGGERTTAAQLTGAQSYNYTHTAGAGA